MNEELPKEFKRQLGHNYAKVESEVQATEWANQKIAAAFLAPYLRDKTCSDRQIRKLAEQECIIRNKVTGKINSSSLIAYRDRLNR